MLKVRILTTCNYCNGQAYLPIGEAVSATGHKYIKHRRCPKCDGSGIRPQWITLDELSKLLMEQQNEPVTTFAVSSSQQ